MTVVAHSFILWFQVGISCLGTTSTCRTTDHGYALESFLMMFELAGCFQAVVAAEESCLVGTDVMTVKPQRMVRNDVDSHDSSEKTLGRRRRDVSQRLC